MVNVNSIDIAIVTPQLSCTVCSREQHQVNAGLQQTPNVSGSIGMQYLSKYRITLFQNF